MSENSVRRWTAAGLLLAVTLAIALTEWPLGLLPWARFALITGIVSGMLVLFITLVIVDEVMARRNRIKWVAVAQTAFRGLGGAAGDVGEALEVVVTGQLRPGRGSFEEPWGAAFAERISAGRLSDVPANRYGAEDFAPFHAAALRSRLEDPDWCDLAQRATVMIRGKFRTAMTPWLSAMLATPDLAAVQNRVALLDARLMTLQGPILQLALMGEAEEHKGHPRAHYQQLAYDLWQATHVEIAALGEGLHRASRSGSAYVHVDEPQRNRLDRRHRSYLEHVDDRYLSSLATPVISGTIQGDLGPGFKIIDSGSGRSLLRRRSRHSAAPS